MRLALWLALAIVLAFQSATAQPYPGKPVRLVVPNAPGSSGDIVARLITTPLSDKLGQPVVVENRAGAGTVIGTEYVAKAPPDGYTLLVVFGTLAINPAMYKKVPYDAIRDFAPITHAVNLPGIVAVHPSLPVKSVKDLIAVAKVRPNQITFASAGQGTYSHVATELFVTMSGAHLLHVPYKGTGPAATALVSGETQVQTSNILSMLPHVRVGRIRAIAVTGAKRSAIVPELPTVGESGVPGYEAVQWIGLAAPAKTPPDIVARVNRDAVAVLHSRDTIERLARDGADVVASTPEQFGAHIRAEVVKWAKVLRSAGIQPE